MDDELLDLVDENDHVIGTINRQDYGRVVAEQLGYIRASDLFLLNSKGQIYTPVRTADKTIAPNGYDYSVGGHVGAGEEYFSTIVREAKEELNLDIEPEGLEFIAKTTSEDIRYIQSLFLLRENATPELNPSDFVSAEWLYPEEINQKINEGHPAKSSLARSIGLLQKHLAQNS